MVVAFLVFGCTSTERSCFREICLTVLGDCGVQSTRTGCCCGGGTIERDFASVALSLGEEEKVWAGWHVQETLSMVFFSGPSTMLGLGRRLEFV